MNYEVKLYEIEPVWVMSIRTTTSLSTLADVMGAAYQKIYQYLQKNQGKLRGSTEDVFAIYHDEAFCPEKIDVECCFAVKKLLPDSEDICGREVDGGLMIGTVHKGSYDQLEQAYTAIMSWAKQNGYNLLPNMRDIYLNDPCMVEPEDLETKVVWPAQKTTAS